MMQAIGMIFSSAALARPAMLRAAPMPAVAGRRAFARMVDNDQGVTYELQKSAEEWQAELKPEEFYVLRQKGTERPGTGEYNKFYPKTGHFVCAADSCKTPLYSAAAKFDSGCGWPAFDKIVEGSVVTSTDSSLGMTRVEIMCAGCGGHLGHVFPGERMTATNERHCVNSVSVSFVKNAAPPSAVEEPVLKK